MFDYVNTKLWTVLLKIIDKKTIFKVLYKIIILYRTFNNKNHPAFNNKNQNKSNYLHN